MDLRAVGESQGAELARCLRALRASWRRASLASGWRFPADWDIPEVNAVCAAVLAARRTGRAADAEPAISALAGARASSGTGLAETLRDLAALHAVLQRGVDELVAPEVDAMPARLVRLAALGWADVVQDTLTHSQLADPLTGLPTLSYLRTRLAELYRAEAGTYKLVTVRLDFSEVATWCRLTGMVVAADALRAVFDTDETLAALGPSTVAALVPASSGLAADTVALRSALVERLDSDRQLADAGTPHIEVTALPPTHPAACALLDTFAAG